jgi:hypothetical protein
LFPLLASISASFANFFTGLILSAPARSSSTSSVPQHVGDPQRGAAEWGDDGSRQPLLSASERAAREGHRRATVPAYLQTFGDIADTMNWAWKAAQQNKSIIGGTGTIDTPSSSWARGRRNSSRPPARTPAPSRNAAYSLGNAINLWPRAVQRINNGFDEFSKRLAYLGEVRVRASRRALEGLTGDDLHALVQERLQATPLTRTGATPWTIPCGDSSARPSAPPSRPKWARRGACSGRATTTINTIRREVPESRYILPVLGVPANTLGEALRRLPIAAHPRAQPASCSSGPRTSWRGSTAQSIQADAHGRIHHRSQLPPGRDHAQPHGPAHRGWPSKPDRPQGVALEHQPYSIRVGDKWVRYDRYDVLGALLSIPATIVDATTNVPRTSPLAT